jgi:hypothetical protein
MVKGTNITLPAETAAELTEIAKPRRLRNHRAIMADMFVGPVPLCPREITTPNMKAKNNIWKVRASIMVEALSTITDANTSFLPPVWSNILPRNGWLIPFTRTPREAAIETSNRVHPNSSLIGTTNTPKLWRAPVATNPMSIAAAQTYQP